MNRIDTVGLENGVGIVGMEFLLSLDSNKSIDQSSTRNRIGDLELIDVVGDVEEEVGEVSNLEDLVEGNQLDAGYVIRSQLWSSTVRFDAVSQVVDCRLCAVAESGKSYTMSVVS